MTQTDVDNMLAYADELLDAAMDESQRSEEDVVTHMICVNSRQSTTNYFTGFLFKRNVALNHPVTIEGLLDQCKEVDARFEEIDLSPMYCKCEVHPEGYCLDLDQVKDCMRIAQWARAVVMEDTPGY